MMSSHRINRASCLEGEASSVLGNSLECFKSRVNADFAVRVPLESTARCGLPVFFQPRPHTPTVSGVGFHWGERAPMRGGRTWRVCGWLLLAVAGCSHGSGAGREQHPEAWAAEDSGIRTKGGDSATLH